MTVEHAVALLKAIAELAGVLVWPMVVVWLVVHFGPALREFFANLGELTLKAAGIEATAKRKQVEAAVAAGAALAKSSQNNPMSGEDITAGVHRTAALISETLTSRTSQRAHGATILWVDDRPDNNTLERKSLEALGIRIVLSTSTDDALERTRGSRFDAIISDMSRPPDSRAGYTLLDALRARGDETPFVIYAGSNLPEHDAEAKSRGALGSTNRADELFALIFHSLAAY